MTGVERCGGHGTDRIGSGRWRTVRQVRNGAELRGGVSNGMAGKEC